MIPEIGVSVKGQYVVINLCARRGGMYFDQIELNWNVAGYDPHIKIAKPNGIFGKWDKKGYLLILDRFSILSDCILVCLLGTGEVYIVNIIVAPSLLAPSGALVFIMFY